MNSNACNLLVSVIRDNWFNWVKSVWVIFQLVSYTHFHLNVFLLLCQPSVWAVEGEVLILSKTWSTHSANISITVLHFPSLLSFLVISFHIFSSLSVLFLSFNHANVLISLLFLFFCVLTTSLPLFLKETWSLFSARLIVRSLCKDSRGEPSLKIAWISNLVKPEPPVSSCISVGALVLVSPPPCCPLLLLSVSYLCLSACLSFLHCGHPSLCSLYTVSITAAPACLHNTCEGGGLIRLWSGLIISFHLRDFSKGF